MNRLNILRCLTLVANLLGMLPACSKGDDASNTSATGGTGGNGGNGGNGGTTQAAGGANATSSSLGGSTSVATTVVVNVGPPCTPDGPARSDISNAKTIASDVQSIEITPNGILYLVHEKGVYQLATGATTPELLIAAPDDTAVGHSMMGGVLRSDGTNVYFAVDNNLWKTPIANPTNTTLLATAGGSISQVSLDGGYVYYLSSNEGTIGRVAAAGGTPEIIEDGANLASSMAISQGYVYFAAFMAGEIARVPVGGGTLEWMTTTGDSANAVAVSDTTIYWGNYGALNATPIGSSNHTTYLGRGGIDSFGDPGRFERAWLVSDRIYWIDDSESFGWTKTDGTKCGLIVQGDWMEWAEDMAVAADAVYVVVGEVLYKIPL